MTLPKTGLLRVSAISVEKNTNKVHILCSTIYGTRGTRKYTLILPQPMRTQLMSLKKSEKIPLDFSSCVVVIIPQWNTLLDIERTHGEDSMQQSGTL